MKSNNKIVGQVGESVALEYLLAKGYVLVEKNFSNKWGEIDIIMKDKQKLVFVEVKTKLGNQFGIPEEMFGPRKKAAVVKMAVMYNKGIEVDCRVDMVAVDLNLDMSLRGIRHYENV